MPVEVAERELAQVVGPGLLEETEGAEVRDRVGARQGLDVVAEIPPPEKQTPAALAIFQKAEIEKWWPIIKEADIKPQ